MVPPVANLLDNAVLFGEKGHNRCMGHKGKGTETPGDGGGISTIPFPGPTRRLLFPKQQQQGSRGLFQPGFVVRLERTGTG